jgi:hypothetical protein
MRMKPHLSTRVGLVALTSGVLLAVGLMPVGAKPLPPGEMISHGSVVGPDDGGGKSHNYLDQHGPDTGHLPGSSSNVDLVGTLKLTNQVGDISDVSALQTEDGGWYAYLGDWGAKCQTGGVHVVNFSDPANPVKLGFLNAGGTGYQTEGVQALHLDTSDFTGDVLVVSNEWCLPKVNPKLNPGGITIYDITDPTNITRMVDAFGDFDLHGSRANEAHSVIAWDAGDGHAYAAAIDNEELEDVDLFEITDPTSPVLLAETELPDVHINGYGHNKMSHDFDVLQFPDGSWHLMVSDWDAGWIDVDVTDPSNPVIVGDFDYAACDQVVPTACPPEGNAHQGEWNSDGSLFVGTDEDFGPFRLAIEFTDGPLVGQTYAAGEFGFTVPLGTVTGDGILNGPIVFGGYGCPDSPPGEIPPPPAVDAGEEKIIVFQRGPIDDPNTTAASCFFSDKIRAGEEAGYNVVIVANHHAGSLEGHEAHAFLCGSQGSPVLGLAAGLCVGHQFMHEAFGTTPDFTLPYPVPPVNEPAPGTVGVGEIRAESEFDGWGYSRVIDTSSPSAPTEVGQITIPETDDPAFASGFGDLTVHETEVPRGDPNEGGPAPDDDLVAYFSWYSGGFRVVDITDPANPAELGHYIDPNGNNFWGVALAEDENGDRIVLASDRDYGLFVFRYVGSLP